MTAIKSVAVCFAMLSLLSLPRHASAQLTSLGQCQRFIDLNANTPEPQFASCFATGRVGEAGEFRGSDVFGSAEVVEAVGPKDSGLYDVRVSIFASGDYPPFLAFAHVEVRGDGPEVCELYTSGESASLAVPVCSPSTVSSRWWLSRVARTKLGLDVWEVAEPGGRRALAKAGCRGASQSRVVGAPAAWPGCVGEAYG